MGRLRFPAKEGATKKEAVSWLFWLTAGLLLWGVIPGAVLFCQLAHYNHHDIGLRIVPLYNGRPMVACGEARYDHTQVRSSTQILKDNAVGELSQDETVPILEPVEGDYVYGSDNRWYKVWWGGTERFVYYELLRERDISKCLPKRSSVAD